MGKRFKNDERFKISEAVKISRILFIILTLVMVGCFSLEGTYVATYNTLTGTNKEKLYINKNHSFVFYPPYDGMSFFYKSTMGTWTKQGNYLILNSDFQDTIIFRFQEMTNPEIHRDSILFEFYDMITGKPIKGEEIFYESMKNTIDIISGEPIEEAILNYGWDNTLFFGETDEKGTVMLPKNEKCEIFSFIVAKYKLSDKETNVLRVEKKQFLYWTMINEQYKIGKKKLIYSPYEGFEIEFIKQKGSVPK